MRLNGKKRRKMYKQKQAQRFLQVGSPYGKTCSDMFYWDFHKQDYYHRNGDKPFYILHLAMLIGCRCSVNYIYAS